MAKLNGVKTVSERIIYGGAEYVQTEESAQAGDIVRNDVGYSFMPQGAFYETYEDSDGVVVVADEDGDELGVVEDEKYTVFRKVTVESVPITAETSTAPTLPDRLPAEYVIHDGKVYRKEARKAEVGEKVIALRNSVNVYFPGDIGVKVSDYGTEFIDFEGRRKELACSYPHGYNVLVPTDSVTINGMAYALEKRKANVGENVLIVEKFSYGNIADIKTVKAIWEDVRYGVVTETGLTRHSRYMVLIPQKTPATTPQYREVKRKANVGERIRIVAAEQAEGCYGNGDELTVKTADRWSNGRAVTVEEFNQAIYHREYVVLEPVDASAPKRLQVGDYVKVVCYGGSHSYSIGDIVKVTVVNTDETFRGEVISTGRVGNWLLADQIELLTPAEAEAHRKQAEETAAKAAETAKWAKIGRKVNEFKTGDIVESTRVNTAAGLKPGDISTVKRYDGSGVYLTQMNPNGISAWTPQDWIKLVTPVESRFDRN